MLRWLFGRRKKRPEENKANTITFTYDDVKEKIEEQTKVSSVENIGEMQDRRHDLDYQLSLIEPMMDKGHILPYPVERVVILLSKAKLYEEELRICQYVKHWCEVAESNYDGQSAMYWKSPSLERIVARIPKVEAKVRKSKSRL